MVDNMQARIKLDRELGYMGFANARDIAHIHASASRYGAQQSAAATRYGADVSANSTPFKYGANKVDKYMKENFSWWK